MDANRIKASIQLVGTSIVDLHINNGFLAYNEMMPGEKSIDVAYAVRDIRLSQDQAKKNGLLDLIISLSATIDGRTFELHMTMRGLFEIPAECEDADFKKMLEINGCAALYSMARASVSSISTQMFTVGNIVLPLVNFIRFHELQETENKEET